METWKEVLVGQIPHNIYSATVQAGEETGTAVILYSFTDTVTISFGPTSVVRVIDERVALLKLFDDGNMEEFHAAGFPNTIYEIEGGELGEFTKAISGTRYEPGELRHYAIMTVNYIIEVVTEFAVQVQIGPATPN